MILNKFFLKEPFVTFMGDLRALLAAIMSASSSIFSNGSDFSAKEIFARVLLNLYSSAAARKCRLSVFSCASERLLNVVNRLTTGRRVARPALAISRFSRELISLKCVGYKYCKAINFGTEF